MTKPIRSRIAGCGAYLPSEIVKTDDLAEEVNPERFGIPNNFLSKRVGIIERRVAPPKVMQSDMAVESANIALKESGVNRKDIDCVIFCGIEGDYSEPATAHIVQDKVGTNGKVVFDVSNACNGFMSGVYIANNLITSGAIEAALVVTGERTTDVLYSAIPELKDTKDETAFRESWGILTVGDAGGAMVLTKSDTKEGIIDINTFADSSVWKYCYFGRDKDGLLAVKMMMKQIVACDRKWQKQVMSATYEKFNWSGEDVDHVYTHQTGYKMQQDIANVCGVPFAKVVQTYEKFGNITTATIPVSRYLFPPKPGEKSLLLGSGSGMTLIQAGVMD